MRSMILVFFVALLAASTVAADASCADLQRDTTAGAPVKMTASGVRYRVVAAGAALPQPGNIVLLNYDLCLADGTHVQASSPKDPFAFKFGGKQVIPGFEEVVGLTGVGGVIEAYLPFAVSYGEKGRPPIIPPRADLLYRIEVLDLKARALSDVLQEALDAGGIAVMKAAYKDAKAKKFAGLYAGEGDLNGMGYRLIGKKRFAPALAVMLLNTERFPNSGNAFDSLAEAYLDAGYPNLAARSYRKSLELDPSNDNAREALKKLP